MLEQNKWYDFPDFKALLDERLRSIDSADYFCNTTHKWLREAWIAREFGQQVSADRIRLALESEWPDFEVVLHDSSRLNCESVEADREDRRRGDEYRQAKRLGYPMEHASEITAVGTRQQVESALSSAIQRKLRKMTPNTAALVIYLNLGGGIWRPEIEPTIAKMTIGGLERFSSVWTLWSGHLYRTWPDGRLSVESKPTQ